MVKLYLLLLLAVLTAVIVSTRWLPWWGAAIAIPVTILFLIWLTFWLIKRWFRAAMSKGLAEAVAPLAGATVTVHACHSVPEPAAVARDRDRDRMEGAELVETPDDEPEVPDEREPVRWAAVEFTLRPDPVLAEQAVAEAAEAIAKMEGAARDDETDHDAQDPDDHDRFDGASWNPQNFSLVPADTPPYDPKHEGVFAMAMRMQAAVSRTERLSDDGEEVLLDTDEWSDDLHESEDSDHTTDIGLDQGPARLRLTFGIPEKLNGPVKLRYLTLDLAELTLPPR